MKIKKFLKEKLPYFMLGFIVAGITGVYAASTILGSTVLYDSSKGYTSEETVTGALDELYEKAIEKGVVVPPPVGRIVTGSSLDTVGTEIALGSGANQQNFYVISSTNDTVTALAKYNLVRTSSTSISADALQATSATDYNTVRFDDNSSTYAGSEMETYMNNYATKLNALYSIPSNALITARAISKDELVSLGCPTNGGTCNFGANTWLSGRYWSGSAGDSFNVLPVRDSNLTGDMYATSGGYGARAVITISKSLF